MAQLIVRNIDAALVRALRRRAAQHGRSAEAEHRDILRQALAADLKRPSFKALLAAMPDIGGGEDFAPPRELPRTVEL